MDRRMMLLVIGLIFGTGIGFLLAAGNGITLDGHDHATDHGPATQAASHDGHGAHQAGHKDTAPLAIPAGPNAPTVTAELFKDPGSGWNLKVDVTHLRFAPENASGAHVDGEGHAHIYVNGAKLARLYGTWFHIDALPTGTVTIDVTLNGNDHREIIVGDAPLRATVVVENSG